MAEHQFRGRREDQRLVTGQGRYTTDHHLQRTGRGAFPARRPRACQDRADRHRGGAQAAGRARHRDRRRHRRGRLEDAAGAVVLQGRRRQLGARFRSVRAWRTSACASSASRWRWSSRRPSTSRRMPPRRIEIEYEDLPVVVDASEALKASAPRVHEEMPDNLAFDYEYGNRAGAEQAFAKAAHVVRVGVTAQRIAGNPMEPKSCIARYDAATDMYDLYCPTQGISDIKAALLAITGLDAGQVPHPLQRRRRRLRRAQRNLSGVPGGAAGRQAHRQAGALDRHALGDDLRRSSRARRRPEGRAGDRRQGQVSRRCASSGWSTRRLLLERRRADQHRRGADQLGHQPLQGAGVLRPAPAGVHQHDADHRLSRRRPPQRRVSLGAAGRGSGGRRSASIRSQLRRRNILAKTRSR